MNGSDDDTSSLKGNKTMGVNNRNGSQETPVKSEEGEWQIKVEAFIMPLTWQLERFCGPNKNLNQNLLRRNEEAKNPSQGSLRASNI